MMQPITEEVRTLRRGAVSVLDGIPWPTRCAFPGEIAFLTDLATATTIPPAAVLERYLDVAEAMKLAKWRAAELGLE